MINPTSYYLEYATLLWARPGGFLQRSRSLRDGFLNEANQKTHIAKLICDSSRIDREAGGWQLQATARMVTGTVTETYSAESIENWTKLWLQYIANIVKMKGDFEIIAMLK